MQQGSDQVSLPASLAMQPVAEPAEAQRAADGPSPAVPASLPAPAVPEGIRLPGVVYLLAFIAVIASLYLARAFFIPVLIGVLATYALRPVVDKLESWRVPRAIAATVILALLVGGISWIAISLRDDAEAMIGKLPEIARKFRHSVTASHAGGPTPLQHVQEAATELQKAAVEVVGTPPGSRAAAAAPEPQVIVWLREYALTQSALLIMVVAQAPLVIMLIFFLLVSGQHFRRKLVVAVGPSLSTKKLTLRILDEIDAQVQHYLLCMLVVNVLVAVGTWLAFEALGMEHAGVWGVAAGILHCVPYLGSAVIAGASGVAAFLQFDSPLMGAYAAASSLFVAGMAGMVLMTWMQSRLSRINAAALFIALLFFGWLWGGWGLLLGAPLVAIAKVICDRIESFHPYSELLGY